MKARLETLKEELFDYGWITSALLLLFLSFIPLLLPMADAIPEPAKPSSQPVRARRHNRVVLIMVDGLGYGKAHDPALMPHLQARIRISAFGMALASFPTITPSGLRAILSGHRMVSEPQLPTGLRTPGEADSVLARAAAADLKAFVIGPFTWPPLFPGGHGARLTVIPYNGPPLLSAHGPRGAVINYDDNVLRAAEPILAQREGPWDFLALHMFEPDSIAHAVGTENDFYRSHLRWLDQRIEELSRRAQEREPTTFVLLADHGQAEDGTHGGLSSIERQVPFMMWGADIKPGKLGQFPLYNAAPTLAALLGVPPPALSEGWPMLEGLQMPPRQRADILIDLLRQRQQRWRTVKAVLPWLQGDPAPRLMEIERAYAAKGFETAASAAESAVRVVDKSIEDALPEKWLWRLIAALWCLVLAASFGLAWRHAEVKTAALAAAVSVACLLVLAFPLLKPNLWAWASGLTLAGSGILMALTLTPGLKNDSGLDSFGWCLWWASLLGIAFQEILDVSIWSWLVLASLFASRAARLKRENALSTALSLAALLACAMLVSGMPSSEVSLIRSVLPEIRLNSMAHIPWRPIAAVLLVLFLAGSYYPFVSSNGGRKQWSAYACAMGPLALAWALVLWTPSIAAWAWLAGLASLAGLAVQRPPVHLRGMWLSAVALSFHRTMADDQQWGLLALATALGWGLAWRTRDAHPLWEGLGLLGVGLWSYKLAGGQLTFSHITVAEGSRLLGEGWHPYLLLALLTLKPLAVIAAPILPRLAIRPLYSVLGIFPLLGALSAGNLTMIWWSRFRTGGDLKLTDDIGFTQTIFVLVLAWLILGLWTAAQAVDALPGRLRRP